jgi:hypothetical protein
MNGLVTLDLLLTKIAIVIRFKMIKRVERATRTRL